MQQESTALRQNQAVQDPQDGVESVSACSLPHNPTPLSDIPIRSKVAARKVPLRTLARDTHVVVRRRAIVSDFDFKLDFRRGGTQKTGITLAHAIEESTVPRAQTNRNLPDLDHAGLRVGTD